MKRLALSLVVMLALPEFVATSSAYDWIYGPQQDVYASTTQLPLSPIGDCHHQFACDAACDDGCCDQSGWIVDLDAVFFRYGRTDGTQNIAGKRNPNKVSSLSLWERGGVRAKGSPSPPRNRV